MKKNFWKCSVAVPLVTAMLISQCYIVLAENLNSSESKTTIINEEERIESMQTKMLSTILSAQEESIQADNRANVAIQRRKDNISSIDNHFKEKQAERMKASATENAEIIIPDIHIQKPEQTISTENITDEEEELVPTNNLIPKHYISGNNDSIISTSTGELVRIEKIIDLPVAGDITMSLNLRYDSGTPAYSEDYSMEGKLRACPVYGVAAGWGFDIPYIREATLYIPELGTYELNSSEGKVYFNNTEVKYLSFYKRRSGGVDYIDVYTKDGVTYSFANSEIRKVTDKYGNYVTYSTDGTLLWGMTDSLGRSVSISYTNDIVVTLPNSQTITLIRESEIVRPSYGVIYDLTLLTSVKRSVANNSYISSQYEYTLANGLDNDGYLMTALMSYAVNMQYGANYYCYEAAPALSYVSSGNYDLSTIFRITENNIVDSDGYTVDWIYYDYEGNHTGYTSDSNTSDIPETYTYSVHVHSGSTSTKYEYTVTAPQRDDDGYFIYPEDRVKTYTHKRYDDYDPPANEDDTESYYSLTEYTYTEAMSYPSTVVTTYPGLNNTTLTEKYVYDEYKNTVMYLSPKSPTTDHTLASAAPYKTIFTYSAPYTADAARGLTDTVTYNMLLSSQYMTDANTTVKTTSTLSSDNKSVASVVTTVNNVAKDKVDYTYDSKGGILSEKKYPDISNTNAFYLTEYAYTYDPYLKKIIINDDSTDIYTQSEYDIMGNIISSKVAGTNDLNSPTTLYEYDGVGRVTKETLPNGTVLNYTHSNTSSVYDTVYGFKRRVYFDGFGNIKNVYKLNSDGAVSVIEQMYNHVNLNGKPLETFVFSENTTYLIDESYDKLGRYLGWSRANEALRYNAYSSEYTEAEKAALEATGSIVYSYGTLTVNNNTIWCNIAATYQNGAAIEKQYFNAYGELVMSCSVLNGQNIGEIYYEYDKNGRLIHKYYEKNNGSDVTIAKYTYDYRGNVLTEKNYNNNTKTTTYDSLGRVLTDSDFKGKFVQYEYDSLSRVTKQITPLNGNVKSITEYTYDSRGNVLTQKVSDNPDNSSVVTYRLTENAYDNMGNLTDVTIYDGTTVLSSVHYEYNAAGNVTKMYEGLNQKYTSSTPSSAYKLTTYSYDYWGNPYTITYADGRIETYLYNGYNRLKQYYKSNNTTYNSGAYSHDMLGRTTVESFAGQHYQDAHELRYTYDIRDNVLKIEEWNVNVPEYSYDEDGNAIYDEYGSPMYVFNNYFIDKIEYTYDTLNRPVTEKTYTGANNAKAVVKSYAYDEFGNKINDIITLDGTQIYNKTSTYDEYLRLATVA